MLSLRCAWIIKNDNVDYLVLASRWTYYTVGDYDGGDMQYIRNNANEPSNQETSLKAFGKGLQDTFAEYAKTDTKVIVILQVSLQKTTPDQIFYNSLLDDRLTSSEISNKSISLKQNNDFQAMNYKKFGQAWFFAKALVVLQSLLYLFLRTLQTYLADLFRMPLMMFLD